MKEGGQSGEYTFCETKPNYKHYPLYTVLPNEPIFLGSTVIRDWNQVLSKQSQFAAFSAQKQMCPQKQTQFKPKTGVRQRNLPNMKNAKQSQS